MKKLLIQLTLLLALSANQAFALRFPLPTSNNDIVGDITTTITKAQQTLFSIARQYDIGFFELLVANPNINPKKLDIGTALVIPTQFILPTIKREGIIVNLATMRLFYFPKNKDYFYTYPIGIGKEDWQTPQGKMSIIEKTKNPMWFVPDSIYEYRIAHGIPTTRVVKAGDDNPLGHYELRLSKPTYLIHGTNDPTSVGLRSSAGCIHLYPEDIEELFSHVALKETVVIIDQPYLLGWNQQQLFLEAHLPLAESRAQYSDIKQTIYDTLDAAKINAAINQQKAIEVIKDHLGIPLNISK